MKRNDCKIFHSNAKLIFSESDIDKACKSINQSVKRKAKNYPCEAWNVLDIIIKHGIKIFEC